MRFLFCFYFGDICNVNGINPTRPPRNGIVRKWEMLLAQFSKKYTETIVLHLLIHALARMALYVNFCLAPILDAFIIFTFLS